MNIANSPLRFQTRLILLLSGSSTLLQRSSLSPTVPQLSLAVGSGTMSCSQRVGRVSRMMPRSRLGSRSKLRLFAKRSGRSVVRAQSIPTTVSATQFALFFPSDLMSRQAPETREVAIYSARTTSVSVRSRPSTIPSISSTNGVRSHRHQLPHDQLLLDCAKLAEGKGSTA